MKTGFGLLISINSQDKQASFKTRKTYKLVCFRECQRKNSEFGEINKHKHTHSIIPNAKPTMCRKAFFLIALLKKEKK